MKREEKLNSQGRQNVAVEQEEQNENIYILFQFFRCYPCGALADITGSFDTMEKAIKEVDKEPDLYDYNEIVDRDTWEIVWKSNKKQ